MPTEECNSVKRLNHGDLFHAKTIAYQTRLRRWRVYNFEYEHFDWFLVCWS